MLVGTPAFAQDTPEEVAAAALEASPVWDGHNDVPGRLRGQFGNVIGDFDFHDTLEGDEWTPGQMHTDLQRLREGRVGAQWWSVWISTSLEEPEAVQVTLEQIDVTHRLIAAFPDDLALALTADDVEAAMAEGRIASLIGMEGGHSIGSSLSVLRQMYDLGARYMTITHNLNTPWADSATDAPEHGGLTEFGITVVQEMARLGMLIDLSHVSEDTMHDTLDATGAPVIFSHSGVRAVNGHARNVPDGVLQRLPENGGIVMVVGLPGYLSEEQRIWYAARQAEQARLEAWWQGRPDLVESGMEEWDQANAMPEATISDWADHIDHVRDVAGIDHIGIGGDYDGMRSGPVGAEDVTGYPPLFTELARRGYSQADLEMIAFGNMMRVMREAEAYAASQAEVPPYESDVRAEAS
nr:dipeptidase [Aurantiacibacter sp. MUD61]